MTVIFRARLILRGLMMCNIFEYWVTLFILIFSMVQKLPKKILKLLAL